MLLNKQQLAEMGESLAAQILTDKGYKIVEQNYRYGRGEIDIIATDPSGGQIVFIEVKARQNLEFGEPEYALTRNKQHQIKKIAEAYLYDKKIREADCRFDVFAILFEDLNNPVVNHYENAF